MRRLTLALSLFPGLALQGLSAPLPSTSPRGLTPRLPEIPAASASATAAAQAPSARCAEPSALQNPSAFNVLELIASPPKTAGSARAADAAFENLKTALKLDLGEDDALAPRLEGALRRMLRSPTARAYTGELSAFASRGASIRLQVGSYPHPGQTALTKGGRIIVEIDRDLLRNPRRARRLPQTLAHEIFGHALYNLRIRASAAAVHFFYRGDETRAHLIGWLVGAELDPRGRPAYEVLDLASVYLRSPTEFFDRIISFHSAYALGVPLDTVRLKSRFVAELARRRDELLRRVTRRRLRVGENRQTMLEVAKDLQAFLDHPASLGLASPREISAAARQTIFDEMEREVSALRARLKAVMRRKSAR